VYKKSALINYTEFKKISDSVQREQRISKKDNEKL